MDIATQVSDRADIAPISADEEIGLIGRLAAPDGDRDQFKFASIRHERKPTNPGRVEEAREQLGGDLLIGALQNELNLGPHRDREIAL